MESKSDIELHSFMLLRHGCVVAEGWWHPYTPERVAPAVLAQQVLYVNGAAFAAAEGLLDLDDTVVQHFPEFQADITDPGSRAMRIRDVASMASGHERETRIEAVERDPREPVRGFLLIPPDRQPGTVSRTTSHAPTRSGVSSSATRVCRCRATCGRACSIRWASTRWAGRRSLAASKVTAGCMRGPKMSPNLGSCISSAGSGTARS